MVCEFIQNLRFELIVRNMAFLFYSPKDMIVRNSLVHLKAIIGGNPVALGEPKVVREVAFF